MVTCITRLFYKLATRKYFFEETPIQDSEAMMLIPVSQYVRARAPAVLCYVATEASTTGERQKVMNTDIGLAFLPCYAKNVNNFLSYLKCKQKANV